MNVEEIINRITEQRMEHIRRFPADLHLIEQDIRIAVAQAIEAALLSVAQDLPFTGNAVVQADIANARSRGE